MAEVFILKDSCKVLNPLESALTKNEGEGSCVVTGDPSNSVHSIGSSEAAGSGVAPAVSVLGLVTYTASSKLDSNSTAAR